MTEGKETTGGTPPDPGVVQDPTKEETASGEVEPPVGESTHHSHHVPHAADSHHVPHAAERAQEEDPLVASEEGRVLQEAEIEAIETSMAWVNLDYGCPQLS